MRSYFHTGEEKLMNELRVVQSMVARQTLADTPCPLLESQLNELKVFTDKLSSLTRQMQEILEPIRK